MLEKIKTWLPVFQGFYGSDLEDDNDLEWTLFNDPDNNQMCEVHKNWILENVTEYIDYSGYRNEMAIEICIAVCEELKSHELIGDYKFASLISPMYYNFRNDHIEVEVEVDIIDLINQCKKDAEEFEQYLHDHYTSYDGFSSHYSTKIWDWFGRLDDCTDGLIMNVTDHCIGAILDFLLHGDNAGCNIDLLYEASNDVYIGDYIDYEKMIEDFNDEFDTDAGPISDIENGLVDVPKDVPKKDCIGQSLFKFAD